MHQCVHLLLQGLVNEMVPENLTVPNIVALDRGYQSEAVHNLIHKASGFVIGTHKKGYNHPFIAADMMTPRLRNTRNPPTAISSSGEKAAYFAIKDISLQCNLGKTRKVKEVALGYREGLGKVVLGYTSVPEYGSNKWCFISKEKLQWSHLLKLMTTNFGNN